MFKRLIVFLLIASITAANFSKLFVFAGFELNKSYITTTLCENRDRPWLHCNGHCYLMKKIKQADDKEKSDERQTGKSLFQDAIADSPTDFQFHLQLLAVLSTHYPNFYFLKHFAAIFQPPKAA